MSIDPVTGMYDPVWGSTIDPLSVGFALYPDGLFLADGFMAASPRFLVRRSGGPVIPARRHG